MSCPICGCTATRVNQTYWCPTCRIYLGENIAVANPQRPAYEPLVPQHSHFSKMFDTFIWVLMGVLYIVVILLLAWFYLSDGFGDSPSIFG